MMRKRKLRHVAMARKVTFHLSIYNLASNLPPEIVDGARAVSVP